MSNVPADPSLALVFPGQGSQSVGMLAALATDFPVVQATFAEASEVLGYDLWALVQQGPKELLDETERTQPAMLAAGVATWRAWCAAGGAMPARMAGHSLGEITALTCAGSFAFTDAVRLVQFRGRVMQEAVPKGTGAMAAILGLEDEGIEAACAEAAQGEVVEAVNYNTPGQVVIAGHATAVARAIEACKARGAKRAALLPVSVPAHSSLMHGAGERLRTELAGMAVQAPACEVYAIGLGRHTTPDSVRDNVVRQLYGAVRWTATVQDLLANGTRRLVECGPGKVLTSMNRRIDRNKDIAMVAVEDPASLKDALGGNA
jgi:[acyl-carrier-protein] S-malonyltransferase